MIEKQIEPFWQIECIERGRLFGERWRDIGCNARKGRHGKVVPQDLVRITVAGVTGFGWSTVSPDKAKTFIGRKLYDIFTPNGRIQPEFREIEYPLLDWLGQITQKPVYALFRLKNSDMAAPPPLIPCYDATVYFDDLETADDAAALQLMQNIAIESWDAGHRAFKIKVGRGARHMPLLQGIRRDIQIIKGIRNAVGPIAQMMIDANNSYNLNIAKEVLEATADVKLTFMEEPFYEDPILYEDLKSWMERNRINVMIADGEGLTAAPAILDWAKQGLIDVIQFDIRFYGFNNILEVEDKLRGSTVMQAPHNYGGPFGNFASCHIAPAIERFLTIEWDEVRVAGLDSSGYVMKEGKVQVPPEPGFGLKLDDVLFRKSVQQEGWSLYAK